MTDTQMADDLRARAIECIEQGDYNRARDFYRAVTMLSAEKDDLANLSAVESQSSLSHLNAIWSSQRSWFAGFLLAGNFPVDDAVRLYSELLETDLSPENRWRVQCKRIELTVAKGARQPGLVSDFLDAWNYLERLGPRGVPLMWGMAKSLVRGDNDEALAFLVKLLADGRFPKVLRPLVVAKVAELNELYSLRAGASGTT